MILSTAVQAAAGLVAAAALAAAASVAQAAVAADHFLLPDQLAELLSDR